MRAVLKMSSDKLLRKYFTVHMVVNLPLSIKFSTNTVLKVVSNAPG